ncbi:MAG: trypsin-like peptidase domain-containing protein [Chloroflexi bacterium]|nr:trypsin-like peptidase domain-containing protein [Chloroflexota bacterium]
MVLEVLSRAAQISDALGQLTREVTRGVVLVRGSRGSAGSGVVWDTPGLVLTNHHVVPGSSAQLTLSDGRRISARVVRRAPTLDLAALAVDDDVRTLAARVGDSDALRVGDLVVAVGNPMGERNAPSLGILASAPGDVLRLAVTLRPGNSGGALVNAAGEIVGIPHMVTGNGLALAVSTRTVRRFLAGSSGETESEGLDWV